MLQPPRYKKVGKFLAKAMKTHRPDAYPRFLYCKQMSGEPSPGQDTSLSLVTFPSKLDTHLLLGGQREFSGHKDFRRCRDSNPGPSESYTSDIPLDYNPFKVQEDQDVIMFEKELARTVS